MAKIKKQISNEKLVLEVRSGFKVMKSGFKRVDNQIEALAIATKKGFDEVDKKFKQIDSRFDQVETDLKDIKQGLRSSLVERRLNRLEYKVGINKLEE